MKPQAANEIILLPDRKSVIILGTMLEICKISIRERWLSRKDIEHKAEFPADNENHDCIFLLQSKQNGEYKREEYQTCLRRSKESQKNEVIAESVILMPHHEFLILPIDK